MYVLRKSGDDSNVVVSMDAKRVARTRSALEQPLSLGVVAPAAGFPCGRFNLTLLTDKRSVSPDDRFEHPALQLKV